jgi:hypothetical protein
VRLIALAALGVALLAGCGGSRSTVPNVVNQDFPTALAELRDAGFLVSVPYFPPMPAARPEQGEGRLTSYFVVDQRPARGARVRRGSTVALTVCVSAFRGPLASLNEPNRHPPVARVPRLLGRPYDSALVADKHFTAGYWIRVAKVGPLRASASREGLGAFLVVGQTPHPGTALPFAGLRKRLRGVEPRRATVAIALGAGAPSADEPARAALEATAPWARRHLERGFALTRSESRRCPIYPMHSTPHGTTLPSGYCTTAVDLSGPDAVVVYSQDSTYGTELWRARVRAGRLVGVSVRPEPPVNR